MNLVMLGAPGAGKGTQAEKIVSNFGICHVSTGDILRESVAQGNELGRKAGSYMEKGELVPDGIVIGIIRERLKREDCGKGFILDGFPRTIAQAEVLKDVLGKDGRKLDKVLFVKVSEKELLRRLTGRRTCSKCGEIYHISFNPPRENNVCDRCRAELYTREDDKEGTVKKRFEVYMKETSPLISYYEDQSLLEVIDGEQDEGKVYQGIKKVLKENL